MGKFISVPLPINDSTADLPSAADSGTTDAAVADKLTESGQNFLTTVTVGDIVFPTGSASSVYSTVTAVDSNTALSISGTGTTLLEASSQAYKIFTSAAAHSLVNGSGTFTANVKPGDVVINETTGLNGKVTQVISDTELLMDNILFNDNATDVAIIMSQSGKGGRLVSLNNIAMVIPTAGGAGTTPIVISYKTTTAGNDTLTITISAAQAAYSWQNEFEKLMIQTLESPWTDVVAEMPLISAPGGATVPLLYADSVVLA